MSPGTGSSTRSRAASDRELVGHANPHPHWPPADHRRSEQGGDQSLSRRRDKGPSGLLVTPDRARQPKCRPARPPPWLRPLEHARWILARGAGSITRLWRAS